MDLRGALDLLGVGIEVANGLGPHIIVGNRAARVAQRAKARLLVERCEIVLNGAIGIHGAVSKIGVAVVDAKERLIDLATNRLWVHGHRGAQCAHSGNGGSELGLGDLHGLHVLALQRGRCLVDGSLEGFVLGGVLLGGLIIEVLCRLDVLAKLIGNGHVAVGRIELLDLVFAQGTIEHAQLVDLSLKAGHVGCVFMLADDEVHHACGQLPGPGTSTLFLTIHVQRDIFAIARLGDNEVLPAAALGVGTQGMSLPPTVGYELPAVALVQQCAALARKLQNGNFTPQALYRSTGPTGKWSTSSASRQPFRPLHQSPYSYRAGSGRFPKKQGHSAPPLRPHRSP